MANPLKFNNADNFKKSYRRLLPYLSSKDPLSRQLVVDAEGNTFIKEKVKNDKTFFKVKSANQSPSYVRNFALASLLENIYEILLQYSRFGFTWREKITFLQKQCSEEQKQYLEKHSSEEQKLISICGISTYSIVLPFILIECDREDLIFGASYNASHLCDYLSKKENENLDHNDKKSLEMQVKPNKALFELISFIYPEHNQKMEEEILALQEISKALISPLEQKITLYKKLQLSAFFNYPEKIDSLKNLLTIGQDINANREIKPIIDQEQMEWLEMVSIQQHLNDNKIKACKRKIAIIRALLIIKTIKNIRNIMLKSETWYACITDMGNWISPILTAISFFGLSVNQEPLSPEEKVIEQVKIFTLCKEETKKNSAKIIAFYKKISDPLSLFQPPRAGATTSQYTGEKRKSMLSP